jgi:DNA-directed RNA polymerase subunit RPC12/RpoP
MTDTKFVCSVCRSVFSEHRAGINVVDPEEDQIRCPNCGSALIEPDHFAPDEPVIDPLEGPEQEEYGL